MSGRNLTVLGTVIAAGLVLGAGVNTARAQYYYSAPVYVAPAPVYVPPPVVYAPPPVIYHAPVYRTYRVYRSYPRVYHRYPRRSFSFGFGFSRW